MSIYQDTISAFLGLTPIKNYFPDYKYDIDKPEDAICKWGGSTSETNFFKGLKLSDEHKNAFCYGNKGRIRSEETRKKISNGLLNSGYRDSEETKNKKKESRKGKKPFLGKKHSVETKEKMSLAHSGVQKKKVTCPHCEKLVSVHLSQRWHFENCKLKSVPD